MSSWGSLRKSSPIPGRTTRHDSMRSGTTTTRSTEVQGETGPRVREEEEEDEEGEERISPLRRQLRPLPRRLRYQQQLDMISIQNMNQLSINRLGMSRGSRAQKIKLVVEDLVHNGPMFSIRCHAWSSVIELKQSLQKVLRVLPSSLQLFYKNLELDLDNKTLIGYDIKANDSISVKLAPHLENSLGIIHPYSVLTNPSNVISSMVDSIKSGFAKGIKPKLSENGTSGSYFLQNANHSMVAIFKPFDEEPFAPNNPKKYVGELGSQGFRKGIMSGESSTREVAAYMLDQNGFHGVPETTYIEFYHPSFQERQLHETAPVKGNPTIKNKLKKAKTKHGSLQRFVEHDDTIGNYGGNCFTAQQIHKIAILDIRILNCDRNDQNILVTKLEKSEKSEKVIESSNKIKYKKEYKLTPIDHGLSFPDSLEIYDYEIIWINYPQCLLPFSEKELEFISKIDPAKDCEYLKQRLDFRPICLRNFRIAQILLKEAASAGLNIYEISQIMYRTEPEQEEEEKTNKNADKHLSELEKIVKEAENIYQIVKKSGLKTTIEYQIGLIKPLNLQLVHKPKSTILQEIKQSKLEQQDEEEAPENHYKQHISYDKAHTKRSVSLPALKLSQQEQDTRHLHRTSKKDKHKERTVRKENKKIDEDEEEWEEIFFYYFEQMLKRFLKNKQSKQVKRGRYMSQTL